MHAYAGRQRTVSINNQVWSYTGAGENHSYQAACEWLCVYVSACDILDQYKQIEEEGNIEEEGEEGNMF